MTSLIWVVVVVIFGLGSAEAETPSSSQPTSPTQAISTSATSPSIGHDIAELRKKVKQTPQSASAHLELGIALSDAGQWDEARSEFNAALKLQPRDAVTIYNLGLTDLRAAQHMESGPSPAYYQLLDSARTLLLQAGQLDPHLPQLHQHLGYLNHAVGDQEGTIEEYKKAVEAEPDSAEAHNNLGSALGEVENYAEALEEFKKAFALDPASTSTLINLEGAIRRAGKARDLLPECEAAAQKEPNSIAVNLLYALVLYLNTKNDLAMEKFDWVLGKNPNLAGARFFRAEILRVKNMEQEALAEYSRAAGLAPDRSDFAAGYATALAAKGNYLKAESVLRNILKSHNDDSSLHFQLGRVLQKLDQRAEARTEFATASQLQQKAHVKGIVAQDLLDGLAQLRAKNTPQAVAKFKEARSLAPGLPEASFYLAIALAQSGDASGATQAFEEAIQKRPSSAEMHYNFGIALWQSRQGERAISEFRQAIFLRSDYGLAHCALGLALLRSGSAEEGQLEVERSRELGACRPSNAAVSR